MLPERYFTSYNVRFTFTPVALAITTSFPYVISAGKAKSFVIPLIVILPEICATFLSVFTDVIVKEAVGNFSTSKKSGFFKCATNLGEAFSDEIEVASITISPDFKFLLANTKEPFETKIDRKSTRLNSSH